MMYFLEREHLGLPGVTWGYLGLPGGTGGGLEVPEPEATVPHSLISCTDVLTSYRSCDFHITR